MKRLSLILLWSAISAAFIGPGSVTTAAKSGAGHGLSLAWALLFSTLACLALQEASARVTIATGKPLGRVIRTLCGRRRAVPALVLGAVLLGCAAYEMGNILGAVAGAGLRFDIPPVWLTLGTGLLAGLILLAGSVQTVARILGVAVAFMGMAFLACAIQLAPPLTSLLKGLFLPSIPTGAGFLVLGLVGTTVVPYNLFLGSGLARGQSLGEARLGLAVAIPLGGVVSLGILMTGTAVTGEFSFPALAEALVARLGGWAATLFALGLFAAGLSSAITAPLAAALSVQGFVSDPDDDRWQETTWRYRAVWLAVLLFGLGFGLAEIRPIPAILVAQAFNGMLLPLVAVVLWITVNDRSLMGDTYLSDRAQNLWLGICVLLTFVLGTVGLLRALGQAVGMNAPGERTLLATAGVIAAGLALPVLRSIRRGRAGREPKPG